MLWCRLSTIWTPCFLGLRATSPIGLLPSIFPHGFSKKKTMAFPNLHSRRGIPHRSPAARLLQRDCRLLRPSPAWGASPRKTTPADRRCTFRPLWEPLAGGAIAHHGAMQLPAHCWISLCSAPPASLPGFAESACCKSMFQVFQMFQRYVAGVVYQCYKSRSEYCTVVMAIYVCF